MLVFEVLLVSAIILLVTRYQMPRILKNIYSWPNASETRSSTAPGRRYGRKARFPILVPLHFTNLLRYAPHELRTRNISASQDVILTGMKLRNRSQDCCRFKFTGFELDIIDSSDKAPTEPPKPMTWLMYTRPPCY
jgi:hypothetical protein